MRNSLYILLFVFYSCDAQTNSKLPEQSQRTDKNKSSIEQFYLNNKGDSLPSRSTGTVSKGGLENGKLVPYHGTNFQYFDSASYMSERAFVNEKVKRTLIDTYKELESAAPNRKFFIMECSNRKGGKIYPHRTHQNGLSVDFMMPLLKNDKAYYGLDSTGRSHYFLDFDNDGKLSNDKTVSVDFDLVAKQILFIEKNARKNHLKIIKVIIKIEFKDELFATENGKKLKASGIYVVEKLDDLINSLHDDHFHIDFEELK